jgi:hypothetical protein
VTVMKGVGSVFRVIVVHPSLRNPGLLHAAQRCVILQMA